MFEQGQKLSILHSSHLVADLEKVCDYLIVLAGSRVQLAGDVRELLAAHRLTSLEELVLGYRRAAAASGQSGGAAASGHAREVRR